eukprot:gb/GECH01004509.1/.p1 GENE.gb/GECH01004509.1/~~gb/GECH01004509.1/.p1  ORF type:complete len:212 (+),score=37.33 gb/GECH01004509.1/:1-636(+)
MSNRGATKHPKHLLSYEPSLHGGEELLLRVENVGAWLQWGTWDHRRTGILFLSNYRLIYAFCYERTIHPSSLSALRQKQQQQQQQPPQQQQQPGQQKYQQHAFYQYGGMGVMPSGQQPSSQPQGSSDDKNDPGEYGYGPAPPQQPQQQQQQQQQQYPLYHQGGYPPMYMMHPQMYGPTTMQGATTQQHAGQPSTSPHSHGHGHGHGHGKHW